MQSIIALREHVSAHVLRL